MDKEKLLKLVKDIPNDATLGEELRKWYNSHTKKIKKDNSFFENYTLIKPKYYALKSLMNCIFSLLHTIQFNGKIGVYNKYAFKDTFIYDVKKTYIDKHLKKS